VFRIQALPETGSTNDDAARLLGEPGAAGLVLTADVQRTGHGRRGRTWHAPPGSSLLFTAILPRRVPSATLWAVTFWTALGVAEGIEAATGIRVGLQWPNDLLLDGRKCCGILCVSRVVGEQAWVGSGVGLNVVRPAHNDELRAVVPPPAFLSDASPAASHEAGDGDVRARILQTILSAFERRVPALDDARAIAREWETRAALDGTPYRILVDGESAPFDARAKRLASDGGLIVITPGGGERSIALGDARVLRDTT
jgi:BirA family biotin operon repressor/biotin-[acetyl-CoA-carboxylase] ligase